jgi:hypothetical protein
MGRVVIENARQVNSRTGKPSGQEDEARDGSVHSAIAELAAISCGRRPMRFG